MRPPFCEELITADSLSEVRGFVGPRPVAVESPIPTCKSEGAPGRQLGQASPFAQCTHVKPRKGAFVAQVGRAASLMSPEG
jgi:hypothetical protein